MSVDQARELASERRVELPLRERVLWEVGIVAVLLVQEPQEALGRGASEKASSRRLAATEDNVERPAE